MESNNPNVYKLNNLLAFTTSLTTPDKKDIRFNKDRQKWLQEAMDSMVVDIPKKLKGLLDELKQHNEISDSNEVDAMVGLLDEIQEICYDIDASTDCDKFGGMDLIKQLTFSKNIKIQTSAVKCLSVIIDNHEDLKAKFNQEDIKAYVMMVENNMHNNALLLALLSLISAMFANVERNCLTYIELLTTKDLHKRIIDCRVENIQKKFIHTLLNVQITSKELFLRVFDAGFEEYVNACAVSDEVKEALAQLTLPE